MASQSLSLRTSSAIVGTILTSVGNVGLTVGHVLMFCSGSPNLLNGYSDGLFGTISLIFYCFAITLPNVKTWQLFLFTPLFAISWNIFAGQNIPLVASVLISLIFCKIIDRLLPTTLIKESSKPSYINGLRDNLHLVSTIKTSLIYCIALALSLGFIYGYNFVGMLLHHRDLAYHIPGVEKFNGNFKIQLGLSYFYLPEWQGKIANFRESLLLIFFPLLGFLVYWVKIFTLEISSELKKRTLAFVSVSFIIFVSGFLVAFLITTESDGKWNMSRFSYVGDMMGLIVLVLMIDNLPKIKGGFYLFLVFIITVPGNLSFILEKFEAMVLLSPDFIDKFQHMIYLSGMLLR